MTVPRTVVIIDDHGLFREGLHSILARDGALDVVGEGATSADATALVATLRPDVLLLDVEIPGAPLRNDGALGDPDAPGHGHRDSDNACRPDPRGTADGGWGSQIPPEDRCVG
ncbi:response regulator [Cryobacterium sp. MP_3.1]|uniref:response regulator n=1 Tax=Cryobacterium sp. MP_3.1 TaxID=3071711 RepID=UPI002E12A504